MGYANALKEAVMVEATLLAIKEVAKYSLGGAEKKKMAAEIVIKKLNEFEGVIPVLSKYLDDPSVNSVEKSTIEYLVQVVYDNVYKS